MEFLPVEILFQIFKLLDAKTLLNLRKVNDAFKSAIECYNECHNVWKKFCLNDMPDRRLIKNLLTALDNHSNGLVSCFRATWDSVYELWVDLNNLKFSKHYVSFNNKIVKRIYQIMCHENFILCVHSKEILIFDKSSDLLHIHHMKNTLHLATKCYKMLLVSFKSEDELNSNRKFLLMKGMNTAELEVINVIDCCTLAFYFVLYKNTGEISDILEKITYLSLKSSKIRELINTDELLNDFSILDIDVTPDENLLIIHKCGKISLIDYLDNASMKAVKNYLYINIYGTEFLKVTNGTSWFYVKCDLLKISSLLLYANFLILGSKDGYLHIYHTEQLSKLKLENCVWRKRISHNSIQHLCINLIDFNFVILAATSYKIYQIYFRLN